MPVDQQLLDLSAQLGAALKARGLTLTVAESCTGGMLAQIITTIAGSSAWFDCGFVTYSNQAKMSILKVLSNSLETHGAVSEQVAAELAQGALIISQANIAASITGIAGPDGGTEKKPVGTVCFGFARVGQPTLTVTHMFTGTRAQIRGQAVKTCLEYLITQTLAA